MKTTTSFLPIIALVIFVSSLAVLQSCKKEDKPQTAEQKVDSIMRASSTPADTGKQIASGGGSVSLNDKAKKGQTIFYNASFGKIKASCAMCHSDGTDKTKDGHIRAGHTLAGVSSRTTTWNGMYKGDDLQKNAYGARLCASVFQHRGEGDMTKALAQDEVESLNEYLTALNATPGAMTKNLTIQWVAKPTFKDDVQPDEKLVKPAVKAIMKLPGDPGKGQAVFQSTCSNCHDLKSKKVGPSMVDAAADMNYVAQSVRTGSSAMPFFSKDILNDQQIADVIAYIQSSLNQ